MTDARQAAIRETLDKLTRYERHRRFAVMSIAPLGAWVKFEDVEQILADLLADQQEQEPTWDAENELRMAAEARLVAVEQERDSLIAVVTPFVDLCDNCGGTGRIGLGLSCDWCSPVREVLAALTPSRRDV